MTVIDFGIVFDIDGVVHRGGKVIPGAKETIQKVTDLGIPYLFFTNNGMETEAKRAEKVGKTMGLQLPAANFILCHSALKAEAAQIENGLVLVTGYCQMDIVQLMKEIGFKNVHTLDEYAACHPDLVPLQQYSPVSDRQWADDPVELIILLEMSMNWRQDIQIVCDLSMHNGFASNEVSIKNGRTQKPKIVSCNFDLTYVGAHDAVRLGPGAFIEALLAVYRKLTNGEELEFVKHGKPYAPMYAVAAQRLQVQLHQHHSKPELRRIYAIGDNPRSDIRGANNAGDQWTSILVRTGCFQGEGNDPEDPADIVVHDISEAVRCILEIENMR